MCAEKRQSRPTLQRVAKHLYRRGNSYEFFRRIPPDARHLFDGIATKSESFGDVSRREADHMAAELRGQTDRLIAQARQQPDPTARASSLRHAGHVPSSEEVDRAVRTWLADQEAQAAASFDPAARKQTVCDMATIAQLTPVHQRDDRQSSLLGTQWIADALAAANHWSLPVDGREKAYLLDRVGRAQRELAVRVKAELNYEDRPNPTHAMFDPTAFERDRQTPKAATGAPVPIMEVFERYATEQEPAAKTKKKWKVALSSLIQHLGHDDAVRVSPEDIVGWKDSLLSAGEDGTKARGQGTVRNGYLGAIKPVFQWAVRNRLITSNPAGGITVSVPRRRITRTEKGFYKTEAEAVLSAALGTDWIRKATFTSFACRWLPWLCAYTGARVGEMAQLRSEDVWQHEGGIWIVKITPEAGSQKGNRARLVPLHPHLVDQGFIAAIKGRKGALFYDPSQRRTNSESSTQYQRVGERVARWVRSLGIDDPELQPNHGWRHRFISVARDIEMSDDVRIAIVGHSPKTEHQGYGDVSIKAKYEALKRLPRYEVVSKAK